MERDDKGLEKVPMPINQTMPFLIYSPDAVALTPNPSPEGEGRSAVVVGKPLS